MFDLKQFLTLAFQTMRDMHRYVNNDDETNKGTLLIKVIHNPGQTLEDLNCNVY